MAWRDEVTPQQWEEWMQFAKKHSRKSQGRATSLGFEDYAAQGIEKLLKQDKCPPNVQAWLATTINRIYIDRFRKIERRGGPSIREMDDQQWEREMVSFAAGSPSAIVRKRESVSEILELLDMKERTLLIMATAGFDNHQIAHELGYASNKVAATRLKQIIEKVKNGIENAPVDSSNSM